VRPLLARAIGPLAVVTTVVVVFLPLSRSYDLAVFLHAGHALLSGRAIYPAPGSPTVYSGSSFVYPYFAVWPFAGLAALPPGFSGALFLAISVAAVLAACMAGRDGDSFTAACVLASSFAITGLQLGALSPLLFAGAVALWRLRGHPLGFALLAAPVLGAKLFLAPLLLWLLLARRWRALAYATATTATLLLAGFLLGPIGPDSYARLLSALGRHEASAGFGVVGALLRLRLATPAAEASAGALAILVLGAAYLHHRRARDERVLFAGAMLACLELTPVLWSHYLLCLAAIPLIMGARRRWFVLLAIGSWAIAPPHGVRFDNDPFDRLTVAGIAVAIVVFLVFALASRRRAPSPAPAPAASVHPVA
jgi:hypothetical protein